MSIDPASLRVEGSGSGRFSLGAVETRNAPAQTRAGDTPLETKLKQLRGERESAQGALEALESKKAMIQRFSQAGPEKLTPDGKPVDIVQWTAAWDAVGAGLAKIGEDLKLA